MKKIFLVIASIVLMPAFASALDFEMRLKDKITSFNVEASGTGGPDRISGALAIEFGMKEEFILTQKIITGLSWGDLSVALDISNRTGKDITIIVRDHKKGHAWGRVAKAYGIRTDDLLSTMGKAHAASQHGKGHGKMGKGEGEGGFKEKKEHGKGGGGGKGKGH